MKKIVQYGMLLTGIVLCLYTPINRAVNKYNHQTDMQEATDRIGRIEIESINVNLPVFCGTDEEILGKGIGYMEETGPLGGGKNTHSVLAGHCGLPDTDMFLRLSELKEGDEFILHLSGRKLRYEVCKIQVILPTETECLKEQEGRELVSLVTCTPYGINTHRLVVTGERKE